MTEEIDYAKEYDNSGRVEDSEQLIENYALDAALFRGTDNRIADYAMPYGPAPRNNMDIFWPSTDEGEARQSPLVMFVHGGYWRAMDRSSFSHLARGLNANGIAVAIPSYTLCPDINILGIITEIRRACLILHRTFKRPFTVAGHSAGGHLAACAMATDWDRLHSSLPSNLVSSGMGISGLYDLLPILQTPVNDAVQMDEEVAIKASPVRWAPEAGQKFQAWVGADESDEYHRQSRELAAQWSLMGTPTDYVSVPDANHFTVIDQLSLPDSPMTKCLVELVNSPSVEFELIEPDEKEIDAALAQFAKDNAAIEEDTAPEPSETKEKTRENSEEDENSDVTEEVVKKEQTPLQKPEAKTKAPAKKKSAPPKPPKKEPKEKEPKEKEQKSKKPASKKKPKEDKPTQAKSAKKQPTKAAKPQKNKAAPKKKP